MSARTAVVGFPTFLPYLIYEKVVVTSIVIEIFSKIRSALLYSVQVLFLDVSSKVIMGSRRVLAHTKKEEAYLISHNFAA